MEDQGLPLDRISSLPPSIIQTILTRMPMRDAFRTSILSQSWRSNKCTLLHDVVYPVLLLHQGPILGFSFYLYGVDSCWEIDQIILHLSRKYALKAFRLLICSGNEHKLLLAFFNLQQLMVLELQSCAFQPPVTFKGFSRLFRLYLHNVSITTKDFLSLISNCPPLKDFTLIGDEKHLLGSWSFNFIELFERLPLLEHLCISSYPIQCLATGVIPQKLPTPLVHLRYLDFQCFGREVDLLSILLLVTSSPNVEKITMEMQQYPTVAVSQTTMNLIDHRDYSHVILDRLRVLEILSFSNLKTGMDFVKLILAKSPRLKKVVISLNSQVDIHGKIKILEEMIQYSRASAKAKIIVSSYW